MPTRCWETLQFTQGACRPTSKGIVTPTFDSINQVELFQKLGLILKMLASREHNSTLKETLKSIDLSSQSLSLGKVKGTLTEHSLSKVKVLDGATSLTKAPTDPTASWQLRILGGCLTPCQ